MRFILALDQGTTSSRALVIDEEGAVRGVGQREFSQHYPRPGWVEHDAEEIWETQLATVRGALEAAGIGASDLAAIGITNQRETTVLWDRRTGDPLARAIVWQDRRTAEVCDRLRAAGHSALVRRRTGLEIDPYFSGTKIAWLLDQIPGARDRAAAGELCAGTIDSWLIHRLTGGAVHATDASNASRTMLFDIARGEWDPELCALLGVPSELLPVVHPSSGVIAEATVAPVGGVPIAGVAGDQQAALFGQGCTERGLAKNTYGTGCFLLLNTGDEPVESRHRLLTTVAWQGQGKTDYALEGSVFVGGAVVQWLRDGLGVIEDASEIEALAGSVPTSDGVVLVPAFTGLGTPHWDAYARGGIFGLTRGTTRAHVARAALEGIALQVADLVEAMEQDAGFPLRELRVDGGATRNGLLLQLQADILGIPVIRPTEAESTARGAAQLAGPGCGLWTAPPRVGEGDTIFEPSPGSHTDGLRDRWRRAVERSRGWEPGEGDA
ncbi:MAG: glycerol kinase GlpK [Planctomycetota bacterium]